MPRGNAHGGSGARHKLTIYDIAEQCGVSAKTVSMAINNKAGVSPETRDRILKVIKEAGYRPHIGARSLRGRTERCLGVILPAPPNVVPISQSLFIWLFKQLYRIFGANGEFICFDLNPYRESPGADYARGLWERRYTGVVIAGPLALNDTTIQNIHKARVPYLALGRLDSLPESSYATVDYEQGAYMSTRFLIERGHRKIAMIKAFRDFQPGVERRRGYARAIEEAGIAFDESLISSVSFDSRSIVNAVYRSLQDKDVTAVVDCSATEDARGLREGARRAGRVPGKDFEIVSWTYTDNAAVLSEASAHVWLPVQESAVEGLELLSDWFLGMRDEPVQVLYPPTLFETVENGEVSKPEHLFDLLD